MFASGDDSESGLGRSITWRGGRPGGSSDRALAFHCGYGLPSVAYQIVTIEKLRLDGI